MNFTMHYGKITKNEKNLVFSMGFNVWRKRKADFKKANRRFGKYRNNGIGFNLDIRKQVLEDCIRANSNEPYWKANFTYIIANDLRSPINAGDKNLILTHFGLNLDLTYPQNYEKYRDKI